MSFNLGTQDMLAWGDVANMAIIAGMALAAIGWLVPPQQH